MMKRPLAAILLACHLLVAALSVSPALHHWLHGDDADDPDHECLATLAAAGMMDCPEVVAATIQAPALLGMSVFLPPQKRDFPAPLESAPGSRAPPLA
jgi:hypothetical protein